MNTTETAQQLLPEAALQQAMQNQLAQVNNARIYGVYEPWLRQQLRANPLLMAASSPAHMESLAREHTTRAIYLPEDCGVSLPLAQEILRRTGADLPVFIEVR